jgi:hypothetical protein
MDVVVFVEGGKEGDDFLFLGFGDVNGFLGDVARFGGGYGPA